MVARIASGLVGSLLVGHLAVAFASASEDQVALLIGSAAYTETTLYNMPKAQEKRWRVLQLPRLRYPRKIEVGHDSLRGTETEILDKLQDVISKRSDSRQYLKYLPQIIQRTKVRQVNGIENINILEWTTESNNTPDMEGGVAFLKNFKGLYSLIDDKRDIFIVKPPHDWADYGAYAEIAKKFSKDNIELVNSFLIALYFWFKDHESFIGNQGGIIAFYGPDDNMHLVVYTDLNTYKENNVTSFLTKKLKSRLNNIKLSRNIFIVKRGRKDFQDLMLENQDGPVGIEVPYILYPVE